ncbi:hypothetical protein E2320_012010 [Naja naja]|nr:hypothetical protein E2320_012010 [Naja naja]
MGTPGRDVAEDISQQINDVLGRLESKQLFQTTWDIVKKRKVGIDNRGMEP